MAGAEKIVHGACLCFQDHCKDEDFVMCKINAFNMAPHQALLKERATHFPELFLWVPSAMGSTKLYGTLWEC